MLIGNQFTICILYVYDILFFCFFVIGLLVFFFLSFSVWSYDVAVP